MDPNAKPVEAVVAAPVTPTPTELPKEVRKSLSLRDRILKAKDAAEIETLLAHGKAYEHASPKTRRRWQQASQTRRAELAKAPNA